MIPAATDWVQIEFSSTASEAEQLSDHLTAAGALAVSMTDEADDPVFEPAPGATTLWPRTAVAGLFAPDVDVQQVLRELQQGLGLDAPPVCRTRRLQDRDWVRVWMERFRPMRFGARLWVCPSGRTPPEGSDTAVIVTLDPGLAFGTGTHATTALCLEWLDRCINPGWELVDYGCGSGILAVAAARLGARHVWAVDIDPQALAATHANALKNQVDAGITASEPAGLPAALQVDCVLANILAGPLIALAPRFADLVRPGGRLVLSGILHTQSAEVMNAYEAEFSFDAPERREDWIRLAAIRR